ncbi:MAG: trigger factor [Candidatus Gracilibacteria bacterium]|jgi:trigger factor
MDYTVKKLPKSEVEIMVTVAAEELAKHYQKACEDMAKEVHVKGFRPGHIPQNVLEQHVDKKHIEEHAKELAMQRTYADIVVKENLQVISRPKVKVEKEEPFTYVAVVAILPTVEIKDHKSIKIAKKEPKVTEKDVEAVLKDLQKYSTIYKDVDRAAKKGDRVEIDFQGFDEEGKEVPNTKSQNHPVIIGENTLIPGFEDNLIGLKKDEKKEFSLTFPKDYGKKDFQNKKLKFKVEVKRVEEAILPELNEEFVEKVTGKKQPVEDLKKDIEKNIHAKKTKEAKQERENEYIEEVLKRTKVELPDDLIHEEAHYILHEMQEEIEQKGLEFEKFLAQAKTTEEDLVKKYTPEAEKRIKIRLALQHIIKEEKIEVTEDEMNEGLENIKSHYPKKEHAKIENDYKKGELKSQLKNRLVLRKFFEKVLE